MCVINDPNRTIYPSTLYIGIRYQFWGSNLHYDEYWARSAVSHSTRSNFTFGTYRFIQHPYIYMNVTFIYINQSMASIRLIEFRPVSILFTKRKFK